MSDISVNREIHGWERISFRFRNVNHRHPGEGRDPCFPVHAVWIPAFAGMTNTVLRSKRWFLTHDGMTSPLRGVNDEMTMTVREALVRRHGDFGTW
ncbi:MAG: hypothetical protein Q4G70_07790 [Pseudomonadota bacterium]|nr:hypothetical protein [Pseudomonadota bacterium]